MGVLSCIHKESSSDPIESEKADMKIDLQCAKFLGTPLRGKDVVSIMKKLDEKNDIFSLDGDFDDEKQYCKILFNGIPCGMNLQWKKLDEEVFITSLSFFASQTLEKAISAMAKGISSYYGEYQQDEQDKTDNYFRWDGVLMRPLHSEETEGMVILF